MTLKPTVGTALLTHKGCLDGTGSALVFVRAGGRLDRIFFRNPSGLVLSQDDLPRDVTEVWYADCCPPDLSDPAAGRPFRVFDHHVSNQRLFGEDPRCVFDMTRSGTSLLAQVLGQDDPVFMTLVRALEAYDLGRFDYKPGQRLADLAGSYSQEEMLDLLVFTDPLDVLYDEGLTARADAMGAARRLYAASAARSAYLTELHVGPSERPFRVGVVVSPHHWKNDVSERVLDIPDVEVAVMVDVVGGNVSLRSRHGGPDCSLIAGFYGGGGHARAAAFKFQKGSSRMLASLFQLVFG